MRIESTIFKAIYYGVYLVISRDTVTSIQSNQTISNLLFNNCTCYMSWIDLICRQTFNNIQSIYQPCNVFCKKCLQYRAWARPEAVNQTEYALSVGTKILTYFENYFGIPFPLPKQGISYYLSVCILYFLKKNHVTKKLNRILKKFIFLVLFQILTRAKVHTIQHLNNLSQFYFQDTMHASFIVWYLFLYVHVLYNFKNARKFCYRYTYKIILIIKCHKNSAAIKSYRLYSF